MIIDIWFVFDIVDIIVSWSTCLNFEFESKMSGEKQFVSNMESMGTEILPESYGLCAFYFSLHLWLSFYQLI